MLSVGLLVLAATLAACQEPGAVSERATDRPEAVAMTADMALQGDDRVDLALYFRHGSGEGAHLVRVTREVEVGEDLPRQAVELLLAGPAPEDGQALVPPLPPATRLLDLTVTDGTAHVDLSREVITEARAVGAQPANELLALAALANTLTEFPGIDAVRLSVEGHRVGRSKGLDVEDFWGGWGLPDRLVRNDEVVGEPMDALVVPDLASFSRSPQTVPGDETAAVTVRSVRVRDQTTYIRLVVEIGDGADPAAAAAAPPARARAVDDRVILVVEQVADYAADLAIDQALAVGDPAFGSISVEREPGSRSVTFTVTTSGRPQFFLHTLTSPTRIVLDLRK